MVYTEIELQHFPSGITVRGKGIGRDKLTKRLMTELGKKVNDQRESNRAESSPLSGPPRRVMFGDELK